MRVAMTPESDRPPPPAEEMARHLVGQWPRVRVDHVTRRVSKGDESRRTASPWAAPGQWEWSNPKPSRDRTLEVDDMTPPTPQHAYPPAPVHIPIGAVEIAGDLVVPPLAEGGVIFAHGSGSARFSARNREVASALNAAGFATLLLDLLTPSEERWDATTGALRFDIAFLARRLSAATDWIAANPTTSDLPIGYFGASTGTAAAISAAALRRDIRAIVSWAGRPDLADALISKVSAPTLLIVGGDDALAMDLNLEALHQLHCQKALQIVPRASHLFEEADALAEVTGLAREWYRRHLTVASPPGVAG